MHVVPDSEPEPREWIIQRCIDAVTTHSEDWPPFEVQLMTRTEMLAALKECQERWPEYEFRGHNVANQRPGADILRSIRYDQHRHTCRCVRLCRDYRRVRSITNPLI